MSFSELITMEQMFHLPIPALNTLIVGCAKETQEHVLNVRIAVGVFLARNSELPKDSRVPMTDVLNIPGMKSTTLRCRCRAAGRMVTGLSDELRQTVLKLTWTSVYTLAQFTAGRDKLSEDHLEQAIHHAVGHPNISVQGLKQHLRHLYHRQHQAEHNELSLDVPVEAVPISLPGTEAAEAHTASSPVPVSQSLWFADDETTVLFPELAPPAILARSSQDTPRKRRKSCGSKLVIQSKSGFTASVRRNDGSGSEASVNGLAPFFELPKNVSLSTSSIAAVQEEMALFHCNELPQLSEMDRRYVHMCRAPLNGPTMKIFKVADILTTTDRPTLQDVGAATSFDRLGPTDGLQLDAVCTDVPTGAFVGVSSSPTTVSWWNNVAASAPGDISFFLRGGLLQAAPVPDGAGVGVFTPVSHCYPARGDGQPQPPLVMDRHSEAGGGCWVGLVSDAVALTPLVVVALSSWPEGNQQKGLHALNKMTQSLTMPSTISALVQLGIHVDVALAAVGDVVVCTGMPHWESLSPGTLVHERVAMQSLDTLREQVLLWQDDRLSCIDKRALMTTFALSVNHVAAMLQAIEASSLVVPSAF